MSMAHSIESRVPLLDNEVIDFAASLPAALKIANGRRKHLLKEAGVPAGAARSCSIARSRDSACRSACWFRGGLTRRVRRRPALADARATRLLRPGFVDRILTSTWPASATTRSGSGSCWCSSCGTGSTSILRSRRPPDRPTSHAFTPRERVATSGRPGALPVPPALPDSETRRARLYEIRWNKSVRNLPFRTSAVPLPAGADVTPLKLQCFFAPLLAFSLQSG